MACIFTSAFDKPITVRRASVNAESWQAIRIESGDAAISLSREEAAQLGADLLNAAEAVPGDVEQTA